MDNKENGGPACLESAGERLVLFDSTGERGGREGRRELLIENGMRVLYVSKEGRRRRLRENNMGGYHTFIDNVYNSTSAKLYMYKKA